MRVDDTLRAAGRAGCVEDVGAAVGGQRQREVVASRRRIDRIDVEDGTRFGGELRGERAIPGVGHEERGPGLVEHLADPRARVPGIERHVELARLEGAEDRGDETRALREQERHRLLGLAAPFADRAGDAIRAGVQPGVGKLLVAATHREAFGVARDLRLEPRGKRLLDLAPLERTKARAGLRLHCQSRPSALAIQVATSCRVIVPFGQKISGLDPHPFVIPDDASASMNLK